MQALRTLYIELREFLGEISEEAVSSYDPSTGLFQVRCGSVGLETQIPEPLYDDQGDPMSPEDRESVSEKLTQIVSDHNSAI